VPGPLAGLRVVDCSAIIAGPIATAFLATYGADVVKLEPLEGDALRGYPSTLPGESRYFLGINRGKRSLAVDLK
jgi:crotonobetainyl-CoA:carnitine CoA-transferase CaiB-like acyl-CoA transferase